MAKMFPDIDPSITRKTIILILFLDPVYLLASTFYVAVLF